MVPRIGWAYVLLAVVFLATGAKLYYLAGMFPNPLAAGAQPTADWLRRGRPSLRRALFGAALVLSAGAVLFSLPVVPAGVLHQTPIVAANYDAGETVGWPTYVKQITNVYRELYAARRARTAILTSNYGEAGAVDHFGPAFGLPHAFSGQTGYLGLGSPPPATAQTVVAVGFERSFLERVFHDVHLAARNWTTISRSTTTSKAHPFGYAPGRCATWHMLWPRFRDT